MHLMPTMPRLPLNVLLLVAVHPKGIQFPSEVNVICVELAPEFVPSLAFSHVKRNAYIMRRNASPMLRRERLKIMISLVRLQALVYVP
jgi:hypothetical protein